VLRAQSQAIGTAIGTQVQHSRRTSAAQPAGQAAYPYGAQVPVQPGQQMVLAPLGAPLYASPEPGSPVLDRLDAGAPVLVTRAVGDTGWVEVLAGGQTGYVWAPQLTPQGFPPPASADR